MPLTKIQSLGITDGTIVNADINASAAIAGTKLSGAGKVLQVVNATYSTDTSTTSTSYVDTGLTATITPSSASNKILIIVSQAFGKSSTNSYVDINLLRAGTSIVSDWVNNLAFTNNTASAAYGHSLNYLDSPNTTSATIYKTQFLSPTASSVQTQINNSVSSITLIEIAA
jgi:hypothetical protein